MKRSIAVWIGLVLGLSLLGFGMASAANVRSGATPRVEKGDVVDGTLYAAGNDLRIEGTVKGDVMCAAQSIDISGTVEGDVLCAGQHITITGHVTGSVRVAGQDVTLSGKVDGSATLLGATTDVTADGSVTHDLTITSQQSTVEGTVGRDIEAIVGDNFTLNSAIGRDLDVTSPSVTLNDKTAVPGSFVYVSDADAQVASGVKVGSTNHKHPVTPERQMVSPVTYVRTIAVVFVGFLIVGIAFLFVSPRAMLAGSRTLQTAPFATLGTGVVLLVLLPMLAVGACLTVVGVPLGIITILAYIISLLVGIAFSAHCLGMAIMRRTGGQQPWHNGLALLVGLLVIFLLALIPYVGGLVMFTAIIWGEGTFWYTIFKHRHPGDLPIVGRKKAS